MSIEDLAGVHRDISAAEGEVLLQTQDLTVFNVTKEAVVVRQAKVVDQLPPIAGEQRVAYTPVEPELPDWWADALIPLDDSETAAAAPADAGS